MDIDKRDLKLELSRFDRLEKVKKTRIALCSLSAAAVVLVILLVFAIGHFRTTIANTNAEAAAAREAEAAVNEETQNPPEAAVSETSTDTTEPTAAVEPTPEPTPEPAPLVDDGSGTTIRICMIGDVLLHEAINQRATTSYGYDYSSLFANISGRLANYDLKILNEETACGGEAFGITGYPSFNGPHEAIDAMANAGFNLACLATNHMLDYGTGPLYSTLDYWHANYPWVGTIGGYYNYEDSENIYVYEKEGFRIAVLNYTYGSNAGSGAVYGEPYALNLLEEEAVFNDIQRAKTVSDYVIVIPHWGTEHNLGYDDQQAYWATMFNEWGVDLVIGAHPHVIEPLEVKTSSTGYTTIIYYSLGNFISNPANANLMVGAMADITLRKNESGIHVDDFGAIPLITHQTTSFTTYFWSEYPADMYYSSVGHIQDPTFTYEYCTDLIYSVFGDRVRP